MSTITVTIMGKQINRKVKYDKIGDRFITYNHETFLLSPVEDKVLHAVSSHLTSWFWDRHTDIDLKMHNLHKLKWDTISNMKVLMSVIEKEFQKHREFLYEFYETDAYALEQWIVYAKECVFEKKHQNTWEQQAQ